MKGWLVKASTRCIAGQRPIVARFWVAAPDFGSAAAAVRFHIGESDIDLEVEELPQTTFRSLGLRAGEARPID